MMGGVNLFNFTHKSSKRQIKTLKAFLKTVALRDNSRRNTLIIIGRVILVWIFAPKVLKSFLNLSFIGNQISQQSFFIRQMKYAVPNLILVNYLTVASSEAVPCRFN